MGNSNWVESRQTHPLIEVTALAAGHSQTALAAGHSQTALAAGHSQTALAAPVVTFSYFSERR